MSGEPLTPNLSDGKTNSAATQSELIPVELDGGIVIRVPVEPLNDEPTSSLEDKRDALRLSYYDARIAAGERGESFPEYKEWLEESLLKQRDFSAGQFERLTGEIARLVDQLAHWRTAFANLKVAVNNP